MVASNHLAIVVVVALAGCGGPASAPAGAGAPDAGSLSDGPPPFTRGIVAGRFNNALCLPFELPAGCRIVLAGVRGACGPGEMPASPSDVAALETARGPAPAGATCQLGELAAPCVDDTAPGWCYVHSSCNADAGEACDQSICASSGFVPNQGYAESWIVCL